MDLGILLFSGGAFCFLSFDDFLMLGEGDGFGTIFDVLLCVF